MNKTFIMDYDDTLAPNQHDYCYPLLDMARYIIDALGQNAPHVQDILNIEEAIDSERVKALGFAMERFPGSFVKTYEKICKDAGFKPQEKHKKDLYEIGMTAYSEDRYRKQGLLRGVPETLDFLKKKGDELLLLSKGDERVQRKKFRSTNIYWWFDHSNVYVVDHKNKQTIESVVGDRDKNLIFKVGNSIRSDINPAIEAGILAIYIPCETWAYEKQHNGIIDETRVITIPKFADIVKIYSQL